MPNETPRQQLARFLGKYDRAIAASARAALACLRRRIPGAQMLVYDNYNALAVGFGPSERASEAVLSIAVYPRWVTLFFLKAADRCGARRGAASHRSCRTGQARHQIRLCQAAPASR